MHIETAASVQTPPLKSPLVIGLSTCKQKIHTSIIYPQPRLRYKYLSELLVVKPRTGYSLRSDSETLLVIPKVTRKTFGDGMEWNGMECFAI